MAKTRSQALKSLIKEEDCKEKPKGVKTSHLMKREGTTGNSNKIVKKNASKPGRTSITEPEIKQEDTDEKKLIKRPFVEWFKERWITREKLIKLIHCVEKDKMSVTEASRKVNMGASSALKYYTLYKNDPEHKIPAIGHARAQKRVIISNQKIETIIRYIVDEKMTIPQVAKKTNTHPKTVSRYYTKYMNDPEHKIPVRNTRSAAMQKENTHTQEQVEKLIGHIYNDNTTIAEAARIVKISWSAAYRYYKAYKNDPENKIPIPNDQRKVHAPHYTVEQIKALIHHIVHDKMTIDEASVKVNMSLPSAKKYYSRYLEDPNHEIPVPGKLTLPLGKRCTQDQINRLIGYIVNDGLFLREASKKVNMSSGTAAQYYQAYLEDPNHNIPQPRKIAKRSTKCCTYEQVKDLINYIVDDKMSLTIASKKVGIGRHTARKYYRKYLDDPDHNIPVPTKNFVRLATPDQVRRFFDYILKDKLTVIDAAEKSGINRQTAYKYHAIYNKGPAHMTTQGKYSNTYGQLKEMIAYIEKDKMPFKDAAKKVKLGIDRARKYYNMYVNDPERKIPIPLASKDSMYAENLKVIAAIFKNNQNNVKTE